MRRLRTPAVALLCLLLAGCAAAGPSDAGPDVTIGIRVDPAAAALLPPAVRNSGELTIVTDGTYVPMEYYADDNETLIGFDIDIGNAVGRVLGVRIAWRTAAFDSLIPGLQAGRYDLGIHGFSISRDRLKAMDFVSYYLSGGSFLVKRGSRIQASTFDDLCGYRVAVLKGASQVESLQDADGRCATAGRPPITILQSPDQNAVALSLVSGRADVIAADKPQIEYQQKQSKGRFCASGSYRTLHSIAGIAVPKNHADLGRPVQAALNALFASGEYQRIAAKWGTGVAGATDQTTPEFARVAAPWGVGADGAVRSARIFTRPEEIPAGNTVYAMPVERGCVDA